MPIRFRRSIRILPGVRLNLSQRGASVSVGKRGASVTAWTAKTYANAGLPGTGLPHRTSSPRLPLPILLLLLPLGVLAGCGLLSLLAAANTQTIRPVATRILLSTSLPPAAAQFVTPAAPVAATGAPAGPVSLASLLPTVTPASGSLGLATPLDVAIWNVGLDDADPQVIAASLAAFQGVDVWGLAEVNRPSLAPALAQAAAEGEGSNFAYVISDSGGGMRLLAIYNAERFDLLESWEIAAINTTGNARAPLVLHLREKATDFPFLFMVNHLYRSRDDERHRQAQLLNEWAASQRLPVVAVGDYNFDWDVANGAASHDLGYDLLTAQGAWRWVQPERLATTQCSGWPCRYDSVLDFVFTAGPALAWPGASQIVALHGDFPDDASKSDHRPVLASFAPGGVPGARFADLAPLAYSPAVGSTEPASPAPAPAAPTPAPPDPVVPTASGGANLRSGPGTNYPVVGGMAVGTPLRITGRNAAGDWLRLTDGTWIAAFLVTGVPGGLAVVAAPAVVPADVAPTAAPVRSQAVAPVSNCDPSYPTICIPVGIGDLDCGEIPYRRFTVVGSDPHRFDGDNDGVGCER